MAEAAARLVLRGITKTFPGVVANDGVSLALMPGEIHALLGENGAGKSTLVKIVNGALRADSGSMVWDGEEVVVGSPAQARRLGIGMVYQHFSLFDSLTVAENVALGLDERAPIRDLARRIREVSERYGLALDPDRHVHTLSVGERQRVEIVRCVLGTPRLLIMDEPTSVLTPQEAGRLFETLRRIAAEGCTILYISHKLEEIRVLCEKATVLRGGRVVATCDPRTETARSLAEMMIGSALAPPARRPAGVGAERLVVRGLSLRPLHPFGMPVKDVGFSVRAGEILGIAGVAGNGQPELLAALSGEALAPEAGSILLDGKPVGRAGPRERRALGMCVVPEERLDQGAVPEMSLAENGFLSGHDRAGLLRGSLLDLGRIRSFAARIVADYGVVASGPAARARSLSGGNLQKFIVGREILQDPEVLVAAHPTWGIDAGAAAAIQQALIDLARRGAAVLVVSQDLDELFAISDRLVAICEGRLSAVRPTAETTVEQAGLLMGGMFDREGNVVEAHAA